MSEFCPSMSEFRALMSEFCPPMSESRVSMSEFKKLQTFKK
jgi:hypothetical protein